MRIRNPTLVFFDKIRQLLAALHTVTHAPGVWPFGYSMECNPQDCWKRTDGLWEARELLHGKDKQVFLWRIEPNYCCGGQPVYTGDRVARFLKNSETEKELHTHGEYSFVWCWSSPRMPTRFVWGMSVGPTRYELRWNGTVLASDTTKVGFRRQVEAVLRSREVKT